MLMNLYRADGVSVEINGLVELRRKLQQTVVNVIKLSLCATLVLTGLSSRVRQEPARHFSLRLKAITGNIRLCKYYQMACTLAYIFSLLINIYFYETFPTITQNI
jgi:hypothetical protein